MNGFEGAYTDEIIGSLEEFGYKVESERLLAADYGVPQLRRRAFFFANRIGVTVTVPAVRRLAPKEEPSLFTKELPSGYVNVWDAIGDLPSLRDGEGDNPCGYAKKPASDYQRLMRTKSEKVHDHVARKLTDPQLERVKHLRPGMGEGIDALPKHLRPRSGYSGAHARLIPDEPAFLRNLENLEELLLPVVPLEPSHAVFRAFQTKTALLGPRPRIVVFVQ